MFVYPANHIFVVGTTRDSIDSLIYKGTQYSGKNPTTDPLDLDPQRTVSAYAYDVGGSDTLRKLKVIR